MTVTRNDDNRDKIVHLYKKYELSANDVFKHQHFTIITRSGIDKIQGAEQISIQYEVVECRPDFAVVKAVATKDNASIETFGSAKYGFGKEGNSATWYIMEMAEKRAMSRAVLKLTGFYELGVFGEDESEDFKRK